MDKWKEMRKRDTYCKDENSPKLTCVIFHFLMPLLITSSNFEVLFISFMKHDSFISSLSLCISFFSNRFVRIFRAKLNSADNVSLSCSHFKE